MLSLLTTAYAEHFKFMGIPIDGDIATFEKALFAKGFTLDEEEPNSALEKWYRGIFAGNKVLLTVTFTAKSNIVVSLTVGYGEMDDSAREKEANRIGEVIKSKYNIDDIVEKEGLTVYFVNNCGKIGVGGKTSTITITYVDIENNKLFQAEKDEDI